VETAGDHEVQDQPMAVVEFDGDTLADAAQGAHGMAFELFDGWLDGAQEEGACYTDLSQWLGYDAWLKRREVGGDVR
jgi:hypothetical protein